MKIHRPLWAAEVVLSQQLFQQQSRWEAWTNECLAHLSLVHPWGIGAVAFDLKALSLEKLKATQLCVRLADGTMIDTHHVDPLPDALDLKTLRLESGGNPLVLLALPLEHANGSNCEFEGVRADRPARHRQQWRRVPDLYGDEDQSMPVMEHALSLRLDSHDNANYITCPVARLMRDGQGVWSIDSSYVPPLLSFRAHAGLLTQLDNLLSQLSAKRERLMGMRRESNQRMADFAVADVSLFWLLNALNTYEPVLADLKAHPARHPEQVYLELVKLAGALLTFSLEHDVDLIPPYHHDRLESVFPPLMGMISTLLEASLPSRVVTLDLEETGPNRWQVSLNDPRLREPGAVDFYLSVKCRDSSALLQTQFPKLCKVGAPDDVDHLINAALDGVPLKSLSHVPAAIPLRLENQYFLLEVASPAGRSMLKHGVCAFYVPGTLEEIKLELFAVLRT
jgi:type VI secretion system protein ImpJ